MLLGLLLGLPLGTWACQVAVSQVDMAPEQQRGQVPDDGWQAVQLPDLWKPHGSDGTQVIWYRVIWQHACPQQATALAVNHMVMAAQVYLNGELLWQDLSLQTPMTRSWNMPRYWLLPAPLLQAENTLLFRLVSEAHPQPGLGSIWLGPPEEVLPQHKHNQWQQREALAINLAISTVIACMFTVIWLMRPREYALGWFALSSLLWSFGMLNVFLTSPWPFELGTTWDRLSLIALIFYACTFTMFCWTFGEMRFPRLTRLIWTVTALLAVLIALAPAMYIGALQLLCTLLYRVLFSAVCLGFVLHVLRTRKPDQLLLGLCMVIFFGLNTYDLLSFLGLVQAFQDIKTLSAPVGSMIMFVIVAWRFVSSLRRIETFNEELQMAVSKTRDELTRILKREHELESANIRLNERLRLTHDLHDSMGSSLMRSIILTEQTRSLERTQFLSILKELRNDLRHVIDGSTSAVSADHSTPAVWLAPLRRRFTLLFDELDVKTRWQLPEQWPFPVDSTRLLALTRFLEEALTNVLKHSHCTELGVTLDADTPDTLTLRVKDNGCGFDPEQVAQSSQGIGMSSMRTRIERIGGKLSIASEPGETCLTVTLGRDCASIT